MSERMYFLNKWMVALLFIALDFIPGPALEKSNNKGHISTIPLFLSNFVLTFAPENPIN